MVSSEMSTSMCGGMSAGIGVDGQGGEQVLDEALSCSTAFGLADQHDRHVGRDDLVAAHDLEVDVDDGVAHRVALQ